MIPLLVLLIMAAIGCLLYVSSRPEESEPSEPPPTEAELLQARLDLLRVERGVDVALAKQEQQMEAERVKAAIKEALKEKP